MAESSKTSLAQGGKIAGGETFKFRHPAQLSFYLSVCERLVLRV